MIVEKDVMSPVNKEDIPKEIGYIGTHMFLKGKKDALGNHVKVKGRLVADGSQQIKDLYDETSSPTVKLDSVMTLLAVAAKYNYHVATMDIGGAYLHAPMTDEIYVQLNPTLSD